jgi:hypothetical protein
VTTTIVALSLAYATLGALLLVMALRTSFAWGIKAAAIVTTSVFFIVSFEQTRDLLGWASEAPLPAHFQLLWTRVIEPNRAYNEPGAIYLWVEELDENNVPSGAPRSHRIRYTEPLAQKVEKARSEIMAGKPQAGAASDMMATETTADAGSATANATPPSGEASRDSGSPIDPAFLANAPGSLDFAPLPPPMLPAKSGG